MKLRSILLTGVVILAPAPAAFASSSYVGTYFDRGGAYGQWLSNNAANSCTACHTTAAGGVSVTNAQLNSYGESWRASNPHPGQTPAGTGPGGRTFPTVFSPFIGPSAVNLAAVVSSMAATASAPSTKVADITVVDTAETPSNITANNVVSVTSGGANFEIIGGALYVKSGVTLTAGTISATVSAEDPTSGEGAVNRGYSVTITGGAPPSPPVPGNLPPTGVLLTNLVAILSERQDVSARVRVADILVTDPDTLGTNALTPIGPDAGVFEIEGGKLYLKAGTALSATGKPTLLVGVAVDDTSVGKSPDAQTASPLTITITAANSPPTLALQNTVGSISQGANAGAHVRVADIVITDDGAAGSVNTLSLAGADAALFEIVGDQLFIRQGVATDAVAKPRLAVTIQVDDPALGSGPEASVEHVVTVVLPLGESLIEGAIDDPRLRPVAAALDDACSSLAVLATGVRTVDQAGLFAACSNLTLDAQANRQIDQAVAALANEEAFAASDATFSMGRAMSDGVFARMGAARTRRGSVDLSGLRFDDRRPGVQSLAYLAPRLLAQGVNEALAKSPLADGKWGVFVSGYLQSGDRSASASAGAVDYDDYGMTLGVDYLFGDSFLAGLAVSYADSEADFANSASRMDTTGVSATLYGSLDSGVLKADAQLSVGPRRYAAAREIAFTSGGVAYNQTALADYDGLEVSLGGRLRWPIDLGPLQAELIAGGSAVISRIDAYQETGAGAFNLRVEEQNDHTVFGEIGGKLSKSFSTPGAVFTATMDAMYNRQAGQGSREIVAGFVADPVRRSTMRLTSADEQDKDFFAVGASLSAELGNGLGLEIGYRTILGLDATDLQQVSLGVFKRF